MHTADWQIGMKAVHVGEKGEQVRRARLDTARDVIGLANQERADLVVIAGDTFEHNAPEPDCVSAVQEILALAACPVLVLPGNHDRLEPGSIWADRRWDAISHLMVLREAACIEVRGVEVLPCPIFARKSNNDPTAWIQQSHSDRLRLVIAHGSVPDEVIGFDDHPIPLNTPERTHADYVALGHWHSTRIYGKRLAYSGTHEPSKFGEDNSGNVLLVDIEKPGAEPYIRTLSTGRLRWTKLGHDTPITSAGELRRVSASIAGFGNPARTLLDVKLSGLLFPAEYSILDEIATQCKQLLHARIDTAGMRPAPEGDDWLHELPPGLVQKTALRLRELSARPGQEGQVATEALLQLFHHSKEALSC